MCPISTSSNTDWPAIKSGLRGDRFLSYWLLRHLRKIGDYQLRHVCLSVRQHGTTRLPLDGFSWNLIIFRKSVEKIQFSLKSDNNNGTLHEDLCTFMIISRWIIFRMRNVSCKTLEEIKTHILCSVTFVFKSCRLWDNMEKYGKARQTTDDIIIRRMRFTSRITKATNTHSTYVILIALPRQEWLRERVSMVRYTFIACLVYYECVSLQVNTRCCLSASTSRDIWATFWSRCTVPVCCWWCCLGSPFGSTEKRQRTESRSVSYVGRTAFMKVLLTWLQNQTGHRQLSRYSD